MQCPCGVQAIGRCQDCGRGLCWSCGNNDRIGHPGTYHTTCGPFVRRRAERARADAARGAVTSSLVSWFTANAFDIFTQRDGVLVAAAVARWVPSDSDGEELAYESETIDVVRFLDDVVETRRVDSHGRRSRQATVVEGYAVAVDAAGNYYELTSLSKRFAPRPLRRRTTHLAIRKPSSALVLRTTGGAMSSPEVTLPREDAEQFAKSRGWQPPTLQPYKE